MQDDDFEKNIITSYENYLNNGYMNLYLEGFCPIYDMFNNERDIENIINNWEDYNDLSEYMLYCIYSLLNMNWYPMWKISVLINRFLDNFLENNPFIFIDEGKEINLYHLLIILIITCNFDNKSLGKILTKISIKDVFSYISYVYDIRIKRNFNTKRVNYEYIYLILLLSKYCLNVCRKELSLKHENNDDFDFITTLSYSIIGHIKNNDMDTHEIDKSLIEIYTEFINLIDEYFIRKINKNIFKKWFYNKKYYQRNPYMNSMIRYLFKFYNDYFDEINLSDIPRE